MLSGEATVTKQKKKAKAPKAKAKVKASKRKKKKAAKRPDPKERVLINFKLSREDRKRVQQLAEKHMDGNVSQWMREAALGFKPGKKRAA